MGDVLAIVNWELDATIGGAPPETGDWQSHYPASSLPFLTEFPSSPQSTPSIQYRDAGTGALLAVHPYPETPDFEPGGVSENDIAYGPNAGAIRSDFLYLCGWDSASVWKLRTATAEQIWRDTGFQTGEPDPPFLSFDAFPLLSPDGSRLYTNNDINGKLAVLDTADGSVLDEIAVVGSISFNNDNAGKVWAPDGTIIFSNNHGSAATHGLYTFDLTTGDVTPFLMLTTLGLSYSGDYLNAFSLAAHPGGDGFAMTVMHHDSTYHSTLVELAFDGTVTNTYSYIASGLDGERLAMFFAVCYSTDGTKLYACADTSWSLIWKFERGSGSVGGDAPFMHCDFLNQADWAAAGSPHDYDPTGLYELWESVISGVGVYRSGALPLRQFQRASATRLGRNAPRLPGPNRYR